MTATPPMTSAEKDEAEQAFAAPRRVNTTTPLQALTLLNHSFTLDMSRALAGRLQGDVNQQITQAYALAFQREPTPTERTAAAQLIASHGNAAFARALFNATELIYLD